MTSTEIKTLTQRLRNRIVATGIVNLTCSQVEDGIVWILSNNPDGKTKIHKIQINDDEFALCSVLKTRTLLKGFTKPDGSKDERTEANLAYNNEAYTVDEQADILNWQMKNATDILAVKRTSTVEDIWVLSHPGGTSTDWMEFAPNGIQCRLKQDVVNALQTLSLIHI